jgi:hypothetical protein
LFSNKWGEVGEDHNAAFFSLGEKKVGFWPQGQISAFILVC